MIRKNILVFEAYPVFSGAQRISLNICKVLRKHNTNITLLLADDPTGILREKFGPYVDNIKIIKTNKRLLVYGNSEKWFNPLNFILSFFLGLIPFYFSCFKIFIELKIDTFYFCDPRGASYVLFPSLFFKGKKIMYLQSKSKLSPFLAKLLILRFSDQVMCPSLDVLESLPDAKNKLVVNYGVDLSQYENIGPVEGEAIDDILGNDLKGVPTLLYAGLIKPQKGIHHLVYAMGELKKKLPNEKFPALLILGSPITKAEVNFQNELKKFCNENGLASNVLWLGRKDNVLYWMKNVDYFIFPTIDREMCTFSDFYGYIESTEGSPVVLIESSLCNCFSLASNVTGVKDTIVNYKNGLLYNPNEEGALVAGLIEAITNKYKFVDFPNKDKFSIESFEKNIQQIFALEA